jgi:putative ABC transport system permease protein
MLPMISALKHHKATVILVALEIALTCAIVTNALFLIGDRLAFMHMTTGVANDQLVWAQTRVLDLGKDERADTQTDPQAADLAALRALPGVKSVAATSALPLSSGSASTSVYRQAGDKSSMLNNVVVWTVSPGLLRTLGVKLVEGRWFRANEHTDYTLFSQKEPWPQAVIVTRSAANQLWPGKDPLGRPIYLGEHGKYVTYVVGVVAHLLNPSINKYQGVDRNLIFPVGKVTTNTKYVLRVQPDQRRAIAHKIPALLRGIDPSRTV